MINYCIRLTSIIRATMAAARWLQSIFMDSRMYECLASPLRPVCVDGLGRLRRRRDRSDNGYKVN